MGGKWGEKGGGGMWPTYLPGEELYLVKVNPTKGRVFPEDSPRSLERKSRRCSSFCGSKTSKLEVSSGPVTEGM